MGIFPKRLVHGFGEKLTIFCFFDIGKIGQEILFENILALQKTFPDFKNKRLKKWENWDFSKGVSPWFWSKIRNFSIFLI